MKEKYFNLLCHGNVELFALDCASLLARMCFYNKIHMLGATLFYGQRLVMLMLCNNYFIYGQSFLLSDIFILAIGSTFAGIYSIAACQIHRQFRRHRVKIRTINGYSLPQEHRYTKMDSVPLMSETSEEEFF